MAHFEKALRISEAHTDRSREEWIAHNRLSWTDKFLDVLVSVLLQGPRKGDLEDEAIVPAQFIRDVKSF